MGIELLSRSVKIDRANANDVTPLQMSVNLGLLPSIEALVAAGADAHHNTNQLLSPFEMAGTNMTLLQALASNKVKSEL